jgi:tRNA threonylcarbamoyladenosine biosynthesis protein TsaB
MPIILCLETSTPVCSVAVVSEKGVLSLVEDLDGNRHASHLTIFIEQALQQAGTKLQLVDAIAVSKGPGSYTGLRVGVSTAKGLCYALQKPLLGVPTLHALAYQIAPYAIQQPTALLMPMLDARRMEVYNAAFNSQVQPVTETQASIVDATSFESLLNQQPIYFAGPGANKCSNVIKHPNAIFINDVHCSAASFLNPVIALYQQQQFEDVAYMEPFYLKEFVGTTPKKRI